MRLLAGGSFFIHLLSFVYLNSYRFGATAGAMNG
ncbi:MAG: hypothetical protein ACJATN_002192 [Neolewinella sp.]|jgi:hypothetical protein